MGPVPAQVVFGVNSGGIGGIDRHLVFLWRWWIETIPVSGYRAMLLEYQIVSITGPILHRFSESISCGILPSTWKTLSSPLGTTRWPWSLVQYVVVWWGQFTNILESQVPQQRDGLSST